MIYKRSEKWASVDSFYSMQSNKQDTLQGASKSIPGGCKLTGGHPV